MLTASITLSKPIILTTACLNMASLDARALEYVAVDIPDNTWLTEKYTVTVEVYVG